MWEPGPGPAKRVMEEEAGSEVSAPRFRTRKGEETNAAETVARVSLEVGMGPDANLCESETTEYLL